ncbi:MFS transporter [Nocardia pseudobrasiliensis]|uniref:EmrB/QacA subfamily drug resistance transporter n=1 Tax=Nocardia pseudobrasiliensis TaxID=45979 RepID=A0A370ICZ8_9NOCA|nr:MFS transporter [Nocardia pseudobrasiliensis]RDI68490.1 EmrB/QacA subfamily drug resistance transporter [Nocardia pseudobrasiliensis]
MNSSALDNEPEHTREPAGSTPSGTASKTTTAAKIALAVVLTGELMNIVDDSVVLTAMPTLQQSLGAGPAVVQWLTAGYALTFALGLITGGRLGDLYGRRRTFLLGTVGFTLASLLCGIAVGPGMLIVARVLQGGAAAVMIPQVLATLHVTFDGENRGRPFGLYGAILATANVAGPILGGVLTEADLFGLSWRPIFLINVPVGVAVIILGRMFITESTAAKADRLDLAGVLLSAIAMVLIVFPLTEGHTHGWPLWCFAMLAGGLLVLAAFLVHQRRRTNDSPLVALSLFKSKQFSGGLSAQLTMALVCGLFFMTWSLYLQHGLGMSPLMAALAFVLLALGELAGAMVATKTAGRFARRLPQTGTLIALAAIAAYALQISGRMEVTLLAMTVPVLLLGFGFGMIGGPIADLTLARVPRESAGSASGLFNTALQLGYALGIALTGPMFFSSTGGAPAGALNRDAFTGVLWWVGGALIVLWALMFCLPRRAR